MLLMVDIGLDGYNAQNVCQLWMFLFKYLNRIHKDWNSDSV